MGFNLHPLEMIMKDNDLVAAILTQIAYDVAISSLESTRSDPRANALQLFHNRARHALPDILVTYEKARSRIQPGSKPKPQTKAVAQEERKTTRFEQPPSTQLLDLALVGECSTCGAKQRVKYSTLTSGEPVRCKCQKGDVVVAKASLDVAKKAIEERRARSRK